MPEIKIPDIFEHDCGNCQGFCCVSMEIAPQHGFPEGKPRSVACEMLHTDPQDEANHFKCEIFSTLAEDGLNLCDRFTCLGAGDTISKFLKDLGFIWASKPDNIDDAKWQIMVHNMHEAYLVLYNLFNYLLRIKNQCNEEFLYRYEAARSTAEKKVKDLAQIIEEGSVKIFYQDVYLNKFHSPIQLAMKQADSDVLMKRLNLEKWW